MTLQPIYNIRNPALRRLLVLMVVPPFAALFIFVVLPLICVIEASIAAVKAVVWDFPRNLFIVSLEVTQAVTDGMREGWYGPKT